MPHYYVTLRAGPVEAVNDEEAHDLIMQAVTVLMDLTKNVVVDVSQTDCSDWLADDLDVVLPHLPTDEEQAIEGYFDHLIDEPGGPDDMLMVVDEFTEPEVLEAMQDGDGSGSPVVCAIDSEERGGDVGW